MLLSPDVIMMGLIGKTSYYKSYRFHFLMRRTGFLFYYFFGSGRGLNPGPCIFYALFQPTDLSSRGLSFLLYYTSVYTRVKHGIVLAKFG